MFGFKQSGAEFDYNKELVVLGKEYGFSVFSGADTRIPELLSLGCAGCIGGFVNILPEYMARQYEICTSGGDKAELDIISSRMKQAGGIIDYITFPVNLIYGMEGRGLEAGVSKMPVSADTAKIGAKIVSELRSLFAEWGVEKPF